MLPFPGFLAGLANVAHMGAKSRGVFLATTLSLTALVVLLWRVVE